MHCAEGVVNNPAQFAVLIDALRIAAFVAYLSGGDIFHRGRRDNIRERQGFFPEDFGAELPRDHPDQN